MICAASIPLSGICLEFSHMSEDVMLNMSILNLTVLFFVYGKPKLLGVSLFLLTLCRFQLILVAPIWLACEFLRQTLSQRLDFNLFRNFFFNREIRATLISFFTPLLICTLLYIFDYHFIFSPQNAASLYDGYKSIDVNGFSIYSFSWSYLLHALWLLPLFYWIFLALGFLRKMPANIKILNLFILCIFLVNILVHEFVAIPYYNYRYLAYFIPIITISSILVAHSLFMSCKWAQTFSLTVLTIVPLFYYSHFVDAGHQNLKQHPLISLNDDKVLLQNLIDSEPANIYFEAVAGKKKVYLTF